MLQCDEAGKTLLGMPANYREFFDLPMEEGSPDRWWLWVNTPEGLVKALSALELDQWRYKLEAKMLEEMRAKPTMKISYDEGMQRWYEKTKPAIISDITRKLKKHLRDL